MARAVLRMMVQVAEVWTSPLTRIASKAPTEEMGLARLRLQAVFRMVPASPVVWMVRAFRAFLALQVVRVFPGAPVEVKGLILAARAVSQVVQECRDQRRRIRLGSKCRNLACHTRVSMDQQCLEPTLPHRSTFLADPPIRIIPVEKGTRVSTVTWVEERPIGPALGSCPEWAPEVPLRLVPKQLVAQVPLAQDPAVSLADPVRQEPAEWAVSAEHLEQLVAQRAPARLQAVPVVSLAGSAVQAVALVARAPADLVPVVPVRVVGLWE